jgi:hypothetical protein
MPSTCTASKVGIYRVIVHCLYARLGALRQSSRVHLTRATWKYVDATDEHGAKTPPVNAHVRGRVRAYNPLIAAGVPYADDYCTFAHCDMCGRRD